MDYTENLGGITLNIQAAGIAVGDDLQAAIKKSINRLSRYYENIEYVNVYLEDKKDKKSNPKQLKMRLGIPGNDPFASEYGDNFKALLPNVEEKLRRQLEKNK